MDELEADVCRLGGEEPQEPGLQIHVGAVQLVDGTVPHGFAQSPLGGRTRSKRSLELATLCLLKADSASVNQELGSLGQNGGSFTLGGAKCC